VGSFLEITILVNGGVLEVVSVFIEKLDSTRGELVDSVTFLESEVGVEPVLDRASLRSGKQEC
jgi:hypothetical protein